MTQSSSPRPQGVLARRRNLLLGSVFALALGGVVAVQPALGPSTPALAQGALTAPSGIAAQYPSFADIVEAVKPAVVSVRVRSDGDSSGSRSMTDMPFFRDLPEDHPFRKFFEDNFGNQQGEQGRRGGQRQVPPRRLQTAQGSGFIVSADGYVVTNNHVIDGASEVEIVDDKGETYTAELVGTDSRTDLALLKIDGQDDMPFVKFAETSPRIGDWVMAIGNPFGLGGTVTAGIVSARVREIGSGPYDDFLQIDAAVNRGNSGGPTFSLTGEVVGVNTAIYSPSGGNVGIAFAVPSEVASRVIAELRENGTVTRGWLGVQIQPITDDIAASLGLEANDGALVAETQPDTPAAKAGIRSGDAIIRLDGETVESPRDLSRRVADLDPGQEIELTLWRDRAETTVTVELGRLPETQPAVARAEPTPSEPTALENLGLSVQPASGVPGAGDEGLVVTEVDASGPVADRLRTGDVITRAGSEDVSSVADMTAQIEAARKSGLRALLLRVRSGDSNRYVAIPIDRG